MGVTRSAADPPFTSYEEPLQTTPPRLYYMPPKQKVTQLSVWKLISATEMEGKTNESES